MIKFYKAIKINKNNWKSKIIKYNRMMVNNNLKLKQVL